MITKFKNYLLESSLFQTTKDFLIDLIENKKGFVRMKRMKEKYVDQINRLDDFTEDNQTIEKKELTQIKNGLDKLYGAYYGGDKAFHDKKKSDLEKIAKNRGVSMYAYENPDPAMQALGMVFNYGISDAKKNLEKFSKVKFTKEEQDFVDKYYSNFDKWVGLDERIEEVRKILNPSAEERKAKEFKEIKGKLNPKIKKAIDEIAENFRKVIEENEKNSYEKSLSRKREEYGDKIPSDDTHERNFRWGGVNNRLYQKDPKISKFSYNFDYILIPNYQEVIDEQANSISYEIIGKFKGKMYSKIGGMVTDIDKEFEVEVVGGNWTYNDIFFTFEDGSRFSIRNKIVSNVNQYETFYYTYPTTFHDAFLPNGEKIPNPNEYSVKKAFNDYYVR